MKREQRPELQVRIKKCQRDKRERKLVLWLKEKRINQNLSAAELARKTGLSRAAITHIEANRCRPTLATLLKMSDGLGLNPDLWPFGTEISLKIISLQEVIKLSKNVTCYLHVLRKKLAG